MRKQDGESVFTKVKHFLIVENYWICVAEELLHAEPSKATGEMRFTVKRISPTVSWNMYHFVKITNVLYFFEINDIII